jgi:chemotaxis signal transduction protein
MEQRTRMLQIFSSGSDRFAVLADDVMTIAEWREPAALPRAPDSVLGVVSIQGRMLTVLDLTQLFEQPQRSGRPSHILALSGDEQLALAIDAPGETIELADADREFEPDSENHPQLIARVIEHNGSEIKVLNPRELFPTAIQGRERRRRRF